MTLTKSNRRREYEQQVGKLAKERRIWTKSRLSCAVVAILPPSRPELSPYPVNDCKFASDIVKPAYKDTLEAEIWIFVRGYPFSKNLGIILTLAKIIILPSPKSEVPVSLNSFLFYSFGQFLPCIFSGHMIGHYVVL